MPRDPLDPVTETDIKVLVAIFLMLLLADVAVVVYWAARGIWGTVS